MTRGEKVGTDREIQVFPFSRKKKRKRKTVEKKGKKGGERIGRQGGRKGGGVCVRS